MSEGHLVRDVLLAWGAHPGLRIWRANTGVGWFAAGKPARKSDTGAYPVRFGISGQADITGLLTNGRRIEIECKVGSGRQSKDQLAFQRMIERFGGLYLLPYSLADVSAVLSPLLGPR